MSETSEDIAPQSREILQNLMFTCMWWGGGQVIQMSIKFCNFAEPYRFHPITLKLGNFTDFKALFPVMLMDLR